VCRLVQRLLNVTRMYKTPCIVLALAAACGTDVTTRPNDQDTTRPDAALDAGPVTDAKPIPPDGIPTGLDPCDEAAYHSDLAWIQTAIFDVSCTTGCHGAATPAAHLSLRPGESHAALVNVASHHTAGWVRVVPSNPGASLLMVQIGGEPGPELEGLMPWGMPKLCDGKIDAIRRWIAAGAPSS
jgi:hypothetical protein